MKKGAKSAWGLLVFLTAAAAILCIPAIALGEPAAANGVAQVGDAEYATLQEAVDAAQPGETVTVLQDVEENVVVGAGADVVLDLNGKVVAGAADANGVYADDTVVVEGKLTVRDSTAPSFGPVVDEDYEDIYPYESGKILGKAPTAKPWAKAVHVRNGGSAVIESGIVESEDSDAVFVNAGSSLEIGRACVKSSQYGVGVEGEGATFRAIGCVIISEDNAAVGGNGTEGAEYGGTSITVEGAVLISHSETDGYLACGIYHPQRGTLDVSACTVYSHGGVGILMRGGTLNMTGGTVVTTGVASGKVGDGATVVDDCYNVVVEDAPGYYDGVNAKASISGGLFVSEGDATSPPLCQMGAEGRLVVTGGTFDADVSAFFDGSIYSQNPQDASEDAGAVVPRVYGIAYDLAGGSLPSGAGNPTTYTYFDEPLALANPTRAGYAFAGWTGTGLADATAQVSIPANSKGDRSYTATWDPEPGVHVEVPDVPAGEGPHATLTDEGAASAAKAGQAALEALKKGEAPAGMAPADAQRLIDVLNAAKDPDKASVVVSPQASVKDAASVAAGDKAAIEGAMADGETVALFLDLSVNMKVVVKDSDGIERAADAPLSRVADPLLFEVRVDPALIAGKNVRIACVHDGKTTVLAPESVDRERGIVRFRASEFSTYALLTSSSQGVGATPSQDGGSAAKRLAKTGDGNGAPVVSLAGVAVLAAAGAAVAAARGRRLGK